MNIPQVPTVKGLQKFLLYILLLAYIALPFFQIRRKRLIKVYFNQEIIIMEIIIDILMRIILIIIMDIIMDII